MYYCAPRFCETKGADHLCSNCTADQHIYYRRIVQSLSYIRNFKLLTIQLKVRFISIKTLVLFTGHTGNITPELLLYVAEPSPCKPFHLFSRCLERLSQPCRNDVLTSLKSKLSLLPTLCEPRREKTGLRGFRPGPTQTGLYKLRKELEA